MTRVDKWMNGISLNLSVYSSRYSRYLGMDMKSGSPGRGLKSENVVRYLEECESFWPNRGTLVQWIQTINSGGIPNFAANLTY